MEKDTNKNSLNSVKSKCYFKTFMNFFCSDSMKTTGKM